MIGYFLHVPYWRLCPQPRQCALTVNLNHVLVHRLDAQTLSHTSWAKTFLLIFRKKEGDKHYCENFTSIDCLLHALYLR